MKDLETMQREGQEKVYKDIIYWVMNPSAREAIFTPKEANDVIDQHTADTWKAAQESMKKSILESGLHEKLNQAMTLKVNKFNPETGEFIESVEFINGSNAEYRLDIETRKEITTKCLVKTQR